MADNMQIKPGTTLRQYRLAEPIGAGGMGEVYLARDTNLERDVAVKVLPRAVAGNTVSTRSGGRSRSWWSCRGSTDRSRPFPPADLLMIEIVPYSC